MNRAAASLRVSCLALLWLAAGPSQVAAQGGVIDSVDVGARFEFRVEAERDAVPFPWNASTHSARDRTRMMIDLDVGSRSYGALYLKGAAVWEDIRASYLEQRFTFEQGDYLWARDFDAWQLRARAFASERRYFVGDLVAPLVLDDLANFSHQTVGARADLRIARRLELMAMFANLADDASNSRRMTYLWGMYTLPKVALGVGYRFDDFAQQSTFNQALFKTELSSGYKALFLALTYQLSAFKEQEFFFPSDDDAFIGEVRLAPLQLRDVARMRVVYRYSSIDANFVNDLSTNRGMEDGHLGALYFSANKVTMNGRLSYWRGRRTTFQDSENERLEAGLWGVINAGLEFVLRGASGDFSDPAANNTDANFFHAGLSNQAKRFRTGVHYMWKNIDTPLSQQLFAVDGKFALSPNWAFHWRVAGGRDFDVNQAVFARLEYRPNDSIFATLSFGHAFVGDGPFLLEDRDYSLSGLSSNVYAIVLRGDF